MGQMGRIRQMGQAGKMGVEKSHVRLFLNLGRFRAIYHWEISTPEEKHCINSLMSLCKDNDLL